MRKKKGPMMLSVELVSMGHSRLMPDIMSGRSVDYHSLSLGLLFWDCLEIDDDENDDMKFLAGKTWLK